MTAPVHTDLPDLSGMSLGDLRSVPAEALADTAATILAQARHSRKNLGSSGPPGRVD